jgi:hypothetical protein
MGDVLLTCFNMLHAVLQEHADFTSLLTRTGNSALPRQQLRISTKLGPAPACASSAVSSCSDLPG